VLRSSLPVDERRRQDEGCPRSLATASVFWLFPFSPMGLYQMISYHNPLDYVIIKSMFEPLLSEYELIYYLE